MKGFSLREIYDCLGTTKVILFWNCIHKCNLLLYSSSYVIYLSLSLFLYNWFCYLQDIHSILTPSSRETRLLDRITDVDNGWNDVDDPIADGWTKRLIDQERSIWFEELYNQDVATREIENEAAVDVEPDNMTLDDGEPNNVDLDDEPLDDVVQRVWLS